MHLCSMLEKVPVLSPMSRGLPHELGGAMVVMIVFPLDKGRHRLASLIMGVEGPIHRIVGAVLHRLGERLRAGIVVAD